MGALLWMMVVMAIGLSIVNMRGILLRLRMVMGKPEWIRLMRAPAGIPDTIQDLRVWVAIIPEQLVQNPGAVPGPEVGMGPQRALVLIPVRPAMQGIPMMLLAIRPIPN
jgi:hypothetical protein